jgi:ribosomal protein L31
MKHKFWVVRHNMLDNTTCRTTQSVGQHNLSGDTICRMTQSVGQHNLSYDSTCQTTQPVRRQKLKLFNFCCPTKFALSSTKCVTSDRKFVFRVNTPTYTYIHMYVCCFCFPTWVGRQCRQDSSFELKLTFTYLTGP